jgi:hypothetical protein
MNVSSLEYLPEHFIAMAAGRIGIEIHQRPV